MANYSLSSQAQNDLAGIYKYGIKYFGQEQATTYLLEMEEFMLELSSRQELSRDASKISTSLKFYNFKAYVIFYLQDGPEEIHVLRVLGKRMNFVEHI
ncbi:type II toxin-antitoxin system RelE/ParE family toxin [Muricauda sp. CAU 1633]|uniref:type II toxin-antitoxin system RelE/ParE family toxin n=1 Tax=Allomuricauda sp. CAU 1633 TaxID=2816036 RepID=UPI001A8E5D73|nr:type II toxin-antitoxin system RelE/ParE family toxin [Muricauda sp. CAU 1633]MBO0322603.1 type II toxin-antitoxin system RelE/ParE family toxin [Muricauda sp. CAU 1633]